MIRFERVSKAFGDKVVLKSVSFEFKPGEIVFILGRSGTGKSVLLKLIVGLLRADSGQICIADEDVTRLPESEYARIRQNCGMVFQSPALFDSMNVFENVAFGLRRHSGRKNQQVSLSETEISARVRESLAMVNLAEIDDRPPTEISFGMQKRVSLARTIAMQPQILLFDEPTTGLDPITTNLINELVRDLSRKLKTTSIVVSHDMNCALAIADRIIVLDEGQIIVSGSVSELKASTHPLVQSFLSESVTLDGGLSR